MKPLHEMNKKEKKEFLSMDLIERLIRLEQRVSASFGEFIKYTDTEYFKHLPEKKQKEFVKYLKDNKRRKFVIGFLFFSFVLIIVLFRSALTARVIEDNFNLPINAIDIGILVFSFIFILTITISMISRKKRENRINPYFDIVHKAYKIKQKISF